MGFILGPFVAMLVLSLALGIPVDVLAWATPLFMLHGLLLHT